MTRSTTRSVRRSPAMRSGALALVAATLLSLAACASIPGSGPVHAGLSDLQQAERLVQFTPAGPAKGATQEQLVRGFLTASQSSLNDYAVAREFLATGYATQWDPYYSVLVSDGSKPYRGDSDTAGVLSVPLVGSVDGMGRLSPVAAGGSTDFRFEFTKEGEEWRISAAPTGIILDREIFVQIWASHQLYFLGAGGRLVPETRWFLSRTQLATEIVNSLIKGPSDVLAEVVHSGFPQGVKLASNSVPVVDGRARVDLTGDGLGVPKAQQEILAQLRASLPTVTGVNRVELFIDGAAVREAPEAPPTQGPVNARQVAGIIGTEFGIISGDKVEPVPGVSERLSMLSVLSMSLARTNAVAAVRTPDGVSIVSNGIVMPIDPRTGLIEPSVDDDLWTWTLSGSATNTVRVTDINGVRLELQAPWLAGTSVKALRVSPGGSLLAALVSDGERTAVLVGGVLRDEEGAPTGLTDEASVEALLSGTGVDLDWVDQLRFVVLTRSGSASRVAIGGPGLFLSDMGSLSSDAVQITGGGSRTGIRVLNSLGELYSPQGGSGWNRVGKSVLVLAKRG